MTDCLFCKIAVGEIAATLVLSDDRLLAFRDLNPQAPTHVLVIPREHYANAADVAAADPALVGAMVTAARKIAAEVVGENSGYRLVFNTGSDAGQTIFHAHLHLLAGARLSAGMV
jgi:histidine triad (HIT) family protein